MVLDPDAPEGLCVVPPALAFPSLFRLVRQHRHLLLPPQHRRPAPRRHWTNSKATLKAVGPGL